MNKHIELVKKWLADPESVTQQELEDNRDAAECAYYAAANAAAVANAAAYATHTAPYTYAADYWVKRYEELQEKGDAD
jgi:hypothetical protein